MATAAMAKADTSAGANANANAPATPAIKVCVLGATGSVGGAALDVLRHLNIPVGALVAGQNDKRMAQLCREFKPRFAAMADAQSARRLRQSLRDENITIIDGAKAINDVAADRRYDTVIAASSGTSAAAAVLAAAHSGKRLLLANKESLILCGDIIMRAAKKNGGEVLPIDSEHCGLFELLADGGDYKKLWLTASGGAARDIPLAQLDEVSPKMALAHPNWRMGAKITVDSATMMNKALEIIEASVLFNAGHSRIGAVLHRQSTAHALVEYADGSMKMQISAADMRLPIAKMLCWNMPSSPSASSGTGILKSLSWGELSAQTFEEVDCRRYPCLQLAYRALAAGGAAGAVLSAANDIAVAKFLRGEIRFTAIARINAEVLDKLGSGNLNSQNLNDDEILTELMAADNAARKMAEAL